MDQMNEVNININSEELLIDDAFQLNNLLSLGNFVVLHLNIRGLQTNFFSLKTLIENLVYKPDVIVCTETHRLPCYTFYNLTNYVIYYNHGKINIADGCVVYIKDSLVEVSNIEIIDNFSYLNTIIKLKNDVSIKITSLYRCHNVKKLDFISVIKNIIDKEKNTKNHIIVGDFNLNIIDTSNSIINDYLNNYFEAGYNPLFNKVTRPCNFDKGPGSCIDNMFFKTSKNNTKIIDHKSIIIQQKFPDHYPILSTFNVKTITKPIEKCYTYLNKKILIDNCSKTNWNSILKMHDPELATNELINLIQNNINNATKTRKIKKNNNVPRKKWITKAILKSIQVKNKLDKNWKNSKNNILSDEYQVKLLEFKYKSYKKKLDIIILNAKKCMKKSL